jgi:aminoglycoside phosphotransferase (APT) family kinase protein
MSPLPDIRQLIREVPALTGLVVRGKMAGGPASDSWLGEKGGVQMVVRIDTPYAAKLGLDRHAELKVLEMVSSAGIGPDIIWADPTAGILVTSFIPGKVWTREDIRESANLDRLAMTLRRLYALPAVGSKFDPAGAANRYAENIGTDAAFDLENRSTELAGELLGGDHRPALCHNDLVHRNIIDSSPVGLIDWEYAGVGDPLFDLAIVTRHHELPAPLTRGFLQACFGTADAKMRERLEAFCTLYDLLSALWYMSICEEPGPDSEYIAELNRTLGRV